MNKRYRMIIIIVAFVFFAGITFVLFSNTFTSKIVGEKEIKKQIETSPYYAQYDVETTEFSIIKRQTNKENKEDIIYINIMGENEEYSVNVNYVLKYILYNDGWLLEEVTPYTPDGKSFSEEITPLKEPNSDVVDMYVSALQFDTYTSKYFSEVKSFDYTVGELKKLSSSLEPNNSYVSYEIEVVYEYSNFNEVVILPVIFEYMTIGDGGWHWYGNVETQAIKRSVELNDGILGTWGSKNSWRTNGEITITDYKAENCKVEYYSINGHDEKLLSGKLELYYYNDLSTGEFSALGLEWSDDTATKSQLPLSIISLIASHAGTQEDDCLFVDVGWGGFWYRY